MKFEHDINSLPGSQYQIKLFGSSNNNKIIIQLKIRFEKKSSLKVRWLSLKMQPPQTLCTVLLFYKEAQAHTWTPSFFLFCLLVLCVFLSFLASPTKARTLCLDSL